MTPTQHAALQSLIYEGTPDEIAQNFKEQGNEYSRESDIAKHRLLYPGVDANRRISYLEALLCNRAACNLELQNYGSVLRDCSKALSINPKSSKAYYRSATALVNLGRYDEAEDCCARCLSYDPNNVVPVAPHFYAEDPTGSTLVLPVFFLYPQYATSDIISDFIEDTTFAAHIEVMFPPQAPPPEWDKKGEYTAGNLVVYATTYRKRLLKIGKKKTLREVCMEAKAKEGQPVDGLQIRDGCIYFVVLPKGPEETKWIEEFKKTREDPGQARRAEHPQLSPGASRRALLVKMSTVTTKIQRTANAPRTPADETEIAVAQALIDLENNVPELKNELRVLTISAAREVDVRGGKKALVIFVPVPQLKAFHKIQQRLTRELEKKFSDRHVVFIAQRRILRKPTRNSRVKQKRPRSRTLTSVHEKILDDLVFPTEIVGKRTRVAVDGSKLLKVLLDSKDATSLEYKLDSFSSVYRRLTGKDVVFEFPVVSQE
ncbi:40S ribosomal protein S7 [Pholiota molesta]|nr:40S ribosomal protein S7 [Pholiota molesta]